MIRPCPSGKVSHPSRGKAEAALRSLVTAREGYAGRVYLCIFCEGWHVGRLKKNAHVNKYRTA